MKKEKTIRTYQRRTKTGKVVTVKQHTAKYDAAEALKEAAKKKGAGDELEALKKKPKKDKNKMSPFDMDIENDKQLEWAKKQLSEGNLSEANERKLQKTIKKYEKSLQGASKPKTSKVSKVEKAPKDSTDPYSAHGFTKDEFKEWYEGTGSKADKKVEKALKKAMGTKAYNALSDKAADEYKKGGAHRFFTKGLEEMKAVTSVKETKVSQKKGEGTSVELPEALVSHLAKRGYKDAKLSKAGVFTYTDSDGSRQKASSKFSPEDLAYYFGGSKKEAKASKESSFKKEISEAKKNIKMYEKSLKSEDTAHGKKVINKKIAGEKAYIEALENGKSLEQARKSYDKASGGAVRAESPSESGTSQVKIGHTTYTTRVDKKTGETLYHDGSKRGGWKTKDEIGVKSSKSKSSKISDSSLKAKGYVPFKDYGTTLYIGKRGKAVYMKTSKGIVKADRDDYADFVTGHNGLSKANRKKLESLGWHEHEEY